MIKSRPLKIFLALLLFVCGFLTCLFWTWGEKSQWKKEREDISQQLDKLVQIIQSLEADYCDSVEWNEDAVIMPEEGGK